MVCGRHVRHGLWLEPLLALFTNEAVYTNLYQTHQLAIDSFIFIIISYFWEAFFMKCAKYVVGRISLVASYVLMRLLVLGQNFVTVWLVVVKQCQVRAEQYWILPLLVICMMMIAASDRETQPVWLLCQIHTSIKQQKYQLPYLLLLQIYIKHNLARIFSIVTTLCFRFNGYMSVVTSDVAAAAGDLVTNIYGLLYWMR